jgi:hypothetical protein
MRSTIEDCFREIVRDKISYFLETMPCWRNSTIDMYVEDPYALKENIVLHFDEEDDMYGSDVECFNIINNDVRLFQEMFEYVRYHEGEYDYDGDVMNMFRTFTRHWIDEQVLDDDGPYNDMIIEMLEAEATERDRQKEVKSIMPLVINRLAIPNELTQSIMLMVGEKV